MCNQNREFEQMKNEQVAAYTQVMDDLKTFLRTAEQDVADLSQRRQQDDSTHLLDSKSVTRDLDAKLAHLQTQHESQLQSTLKQTITTLQSHQQDVIERALQALREDMESKMMRLEAQLHASFDGQITELQHQVKRLEASLAAAKEEAAWIDEQSVAARMADEQRLQAAIDTVARKLDTFATDVPQQLVQVRDALDSEWTERVKVLETRLRAEQQAHTWNGELRLAGVDDRIGHLEKELAAVRALGTSNGSSGGAAAAAEFQALAEQLKREQAASLRAVETRSKQDQLLVEQRMSDLVSKISGLETMVRQEQEASLKALEAILTADK